MLVVLVLFSKILFGQAVWPPDSNAKIEQAYIFNNKLYTPHYVHVDDSENGVKFSTYRLNTHSVFLHTYNLNNMHAPIFTSTSQNIDDKLNTPFVWHILSDSTFTFLKPILSRNWNYRFYNDPLMLKDTSQLIKETIEIWNEFEKGNISYDEMNNSRPYNQHEPYRNRQNITPLEEYYNYYSLQFQAEKFEADYRIIQNQLQYWKNRNVTYDIAKTDASQYIVLLRTEYCLYGWNFYYPEIVNSDIIKYNQVYCYCSTNNQPEFFNKDSLLLQSPHIEDHISSINFDMLPSFNDIQINSIPDSLFFDGYFKGIHQNDNTFIINKKNGNIYYLGLNEITLIGQILIENYPLPFDNIKVFINDLDNNELIVFSDIIWKNTNLPKPDVRILKGQEIKNKFKYIVD